jgi:hypothetical protein
MYCACNRNKYEIDNASRSFRICHKLLYNTHSCTRDLLYVLECNILSVLEVSKEKDCKIPSLIEGMECPSKGVRDPPLHCELFPDLRVGLRVDD